MVCEKCKKNHATVHVTEVMDREKREAHLCETCAHPANAGPLFCFSVPEIVKKLDDQKG